MCYVFSKAETVLCHSVLIFGGYLCLIRLLNLTYNITEQTFTHTVIIFFFPGTFLFLPQLLSNYIHYDNFLYDSDILDNC